MSLSLNRITAPSTAGPYIDTEPLRLCAPRARREVTAAGGQDIWTDGQHRPQSALSPRPMPLAKIHATPPGPLTFSSSPLPSTRSPSSIQLHSSPAIQPSSAPTPPAPQSRGLLSLPSLVFPPPPPAHSLWKNSTIPAPAAPPKQSLVLCPAMI